MNLFAAVQNHGYAATAVILLLSACGLPLPISVVLLTAGAAAHSGALNLALVILCAARCCSCRRHDPLLRRQVYRMVAARRALPPQPQSGDLHLRLGPVLLLAAVRARSSSPSSSPASAPSPLRWPAASTCAFTRFLKLDACGVLFYAATWSTAGFLFAPFLRIIIGWVERVGHVTAATATAAILLYVLWLLGSSLHENRFSNIERVAAEELHDRLKAATHDKVLVIADVRSHGYYDPAAQRIKNSIRVEPNRLREELEALREFMAPECEIYLYCSCARDATSVRVARELEKENCATKVIAGGLKAWIKAGGPLEPVPPTDVEHLPRFN